MCSMHFNNEINYGNGEAIYLTLSLCSWLFVPYFKQTTCFDKFRVFKSLVLVVA